MRRTSKPCAGPGRSWCAFPCWTVPWPELDGLYWAAAFPEDWARELSASPHLARLATLAGEGLPVYAECGGFMVLASALSVTGNAGP